MAKAGMKRSDSKDSNGTQSNQNNNQNNNQKNEVKPVNEIQGKKKHGK